LEIERVKEQQRRRPADASNNKHQPRSRDESRQRLLDTAERLLADHGLNGASLRQIRTAAGEGNNSAIQYHFGDKAGLIREIINRRAQSFEPRREELLSQALLQHQPPDVASLLKVLVLPLGEAVDASGRHVYAKFIMQFLMHFQHQQGVELPAWPAQSALTRATTLLLESLPHLSARALKDRVSWVSMLFLAALIERDNSLEAGKPVEKEKAFIKEVFAAMEAAMLARP
jgi:TetR/AcrR family transcriptional regulator, regulator of cefoperazone and chloramphenicol sensitivity